MPVNAVENRLLLYAVDGENYSPISMTLYDISIDDVVETDDSRSFKCLQNPVSMTITLPHKKISRKTFKKWLMSKGINRDLAEWFCVAVSSFKGKWSYRLLYFNGLFSSTSQDLVNSLFDTLFPIPDPPYTNDKETKK